MKSIIRLLLIMLRARVRSRRSVADVSRVPMRVWPTDLDVLGHMNNGSFLTLQDLGRVDWMVRTGLHDRFKAHRWYPVVVSQTIAYRASLHPWERFVLETRYLGHDDFGVFMEQRFTAHGQVRAQSVVRARFIGPEGTVPISTLLAAAPEVAALPDRVPAWVREWAEHTRLPSTRSDAPSEWHRWGDAPDARGAAGADPGSPSSRG